MISIIIPCYNAEKLVGKCIKSVLRQTYGDLEVIAVNDCSTDNTIGVLRTYASKDSRVKVIDLPKNGGVEWARYHGLQEAKGDFIAFMDADDTMPKDALEMLVRKQQETNADIVEGGIARIFDPYGIIRIYTPQTELVIEQPELFDEYYISFFGISKVKVTLVAKLYRAKRLYDNLELLKPSDYRFGEDLLFSMRLFPLLKKYTRISNCVYEYRWGGMTAKFNKSLYPDQKNLYKIKLAAIKQYDYQKALRWTKIEMCNVFNTNIQQMVTWNIPYEEIKTFFDGEVQSGFVDQITDGITCRGAFFPYLKAHDLDGMIAVSKAEMRKGWKRRLLKRMMAMFYK